MVSCRVCQNSVPQHQTFCPGCGARQIADARRAHANESLLARVVGFFRGLLRTEEEKQAERHLEAGFSLGKYGFEAAIPDHEEAVRLNPSYKSILATTYLGAGDERLGFVGGGGPLMELRLSTFGEMKAKEILSWVSKARQLEGNEVFQYSEAYEGLNKALDGALAMYDKSVDTEPANSKGYSKRARAFKEVADGILVAYGIFPVRSLTRSEPKRRLVKYGNVTVGVCIKQDMPDLGFLPEILWLYEKAHEDYEEALRLDATDTKSCVGLAHMLGQLGRRDEAAGYFDKALAILNKAILADDQDEQSYSERAEIFEELGKIELAISDLERLLTLSTWEFKLDSTRRKIEELRKTKDAGGGGRTG